MYYYLGLKALSLQFIHFCYHPIARDNNFYKSFRPLAFSIGLKTSPQLSTYSTLRVDLQSSLKSPFVPLA
jgi:hypothetical protein